MRYFGNFPDTVEHVTKFCYEISGDFSIVGDYTPVRNFCPHWNCADEECRTDKQDNDRDVAAMLAERQRKLKEDAAKPRVNPLPAP